MCPLQAQMGGQYENTEALGVAAAMKQGSDGKTDLESLEWTARTCGAAPEKYPDYDKACSALTRGRNRRMWAIATKPKQSVTLPKLKFLGEE